MTPQNLKTTGSGGVVNTSRLTGKERKEVREDWKWQKALRLKGRAKNNRRSGVWENQVATSLLARHGYPPWDTVIPEKQWAPPCKLPFSKFLGRFWAAKAMDGTCQGLALLAFVKASEAYLVDLLEDANLCTIHASWVTVILKDFQLGHCNQGESDWSVRPSACLACVSVLGVTVHIPVSTERNLFYCLLLFFLFFKCIAIIRFIVLVYLV